MSFVIANLLAESIEVATWAAVVISAISIGISAFSLWLTPKQAEMQSIRGEAKAAATAVIDARLQAMQAAQDAIAERLERGDLSFDKLDDRALEIERMLNTRLEELQRWFHRECASKQDVEHLSGRLDAIVSSIAERRI